MEASFVSKVVSWYHQDEGTTFFLSKDNCRLDVDARVCHLREFPMPAEVVESLRASDLPVTVKAGDPIHLLSIWVGLEFSSEKMMYVKMEGVDAFLSAVFGGIAPRHVSFRVDISSLKETRKKCTLRPKFTSRKSN